MQSTGTNWRWRFGLKRENPWQSFKLLQVIFLLLYLFKVAQDLKLDCGHAGKHKVASDGIRSTKALIQHFSPGKMSHHVELSLYLLYSALRSNYGLSESAVERCHS